MVGGPSSPSPSHLWVTSKYSFAGNKSICRQTDNCFRSPDPHSCSPDKDPFIAEHGADEEQHSTLRDSKWRCRGQVFCPPAHLQRAAQSSRPRRLADPYL